MHAHEAHVSEMHVYEVHTHEMHVHEVHAHEVHAHEVHAREMHAHEVHSCEVHTYKVHALEMHVRKVLGSPTLQTVVRWSICRDLSCKIRVLALREKRSLLTAVRMLKALEGSD